MQLADDNPLGTIDDEFTAAQHDRNIAQIDLFQDRFGLVQSQVHAERFPVRQP